MDSPHVFKKESMPLLKRERETDSMCRHGVLTTRDSFPLPEIHFIPGRYFSRKRETTHGRLCGKSGPLPNPLLTASAHPNHPFALPALFIPRATPH